jgi:hypothetical protein
VRLMEIKAEVAGKPSSPQDGNGGSSLKSTGGGSSSDRRTLWVSSKKALEGRGIRVLR